MTALFYQIINNIEKITHKIDDPVFWLVPAPIWVKPDEITRPNDQHLHCGRKDTGIETLYLSSLSYVSLKTAIKSRTSGKILPKIPYLDTTTT